MNETSQVVENPQVSPASPTPDPVPPTAVGQARPVGISDDALAMGLRKLTIEQLVGWLERFNYVVKPETPKEELVQACLKLHAAQVKESETIVAKANADAATPPDQMVRMRFMSHESPGAEYEFVYAGPKGFQKDSAGKVKPLPRWRFMHNHVYNVPWWMPKYLNSLMVPADRVVQTNTEGFVQSLYSGDSARQPRFSCSLELSAEQENRMFQKG